MKFRADLPLAIWLFGGLSLAAAAQSPQPIDGATLDGGLLVLRHPGGGLENPADYGFHGILITNGAILRLGNDAKQGAGDYTISNDFAIDHGGIESIAGNPHFTGRVTVRHGGAILITRTKGQDMFFDADISGDGPLVIDNESAGTGGTVRLTNDLSLMGTVTVNGPSPGFSGGRIFLGDANALNQATLIAMGGMRGIDFDPAIKTFSLGGLAGNADIDLKGKALRVGVANSDLVYSGCLTDSTAGGGLIKSGSGTLTLTGHRSSASISVYYGTLVIGGSVETEIKVGDPRIPLTHAVLSGTGSCGDILLQTPGAVVQPGPPGNGAGVITARNFSMIPGSNLSIRLGGNTPGANGPRGYDQVRISGQFSLYGNLQVSLVDGFQPKPGDAFYIMSSSSAAPVLGRFSNLISDEITAAGHRFRVNYTADAAKNNPASTSGHDIALIALAPSR